MVNIFAIYYSAYLPSSFVENIISLCSYHSCDSNADIFISNCAVLNDIFTIYCASKELTQQIPSKSTVFGIKKVFAQRNIKTFKLLFYFKL
jgi:hypothetical protein